MTAKKLFMVLASVAALAASLVTTRLETRAQDDEERGGLADRARLMYERSCSSCHVVPDPAHASDRAWIGQIQFTA